MRYVFLPPYSPDLNPIELAFSAIKAYIRLHGEELRAIMAENNPDLALEAKLFLLQALDSIKVSDVEGWFSFCSYL
jgi:transposase